MYRRGDRVLRRLSSVSAHPRPPLSPRHWLCPRIRRKGTTGVSTGWVTANFVFFDRGTFWVLPLTYFYLPQSARANFFTDLSKFMTFAAAPLVSTPFVRNQAFPPPRRAPPRGISTSPTAAAAGGTPRRACSPSCRPRRRAPRLLTRTTMLVKSHQSSSVIITQGGFARDILPRLTVAWSQHFMASQSLLNKHRSENHGCLA